MQTYSINLDLYSSSSAANQSAMEFAISKSSCCTIASPDLPTYISGKNLYYSTAVESESVLDGATPCGYPARWGVTIIMVTPYPPPLLHKVPIYI